MEKSCIFLNEFLVGGYMIKRLSYRIMPLKHIKKINQRKREMWERHKAFMEYVRLRELKRVGKNNV